MDVWSEESFGDGAHEYETGELALCGSVRLNVALLALLDPRCITTTLAQ
jgi:hypothetical protein